MVHKFCISMWLLLLKSPVAVLNGLPLDCSFRNQKTPVGIICTRFANRRRKKDLIKNLFYSNQHETHAFIDLIKCRKSTYIFIGFKIVVRRFIAPFRFRITHIFIQISKALKICLWNKKTHSVKLKKHLVNLTQSKLDFFNLQIAKNVMWVD